MPPPAVTIYDIAREARVSPATVSRVLTGSARVSDAKRATIERLFRQYDFRPNAVARWLSSGTRIIGLMTSDTRNPYFAALAVECEKAARERGYTVLLCNILDDPALETALVEKLYAQRVEAIIQVGGRVDDRDTDSAYADLVRRVGRRVPFVVAGRLDGVGCYVRRIDEAAGMRLAVDHLAALGHRNIALFGGRMRVRSTWDKTREYRRALAARGLPTRDGYALEGDFAVSGGEACMRRLLAARPRPTAAIAINDYSAVGALRAAAAAGVSVPGDLSLVSFDNTFLSVVTSPALTSVDYDYPAFGTLLVETAIGAARGDDLPVERLVPPRLVTRDSSRPLRGGSGGGRRGGHGGRGEG